MGLFDKFRKPKWQHEDWEVRSEAVKELDDQKILAEIAKNVGYNDTFTFSKAFKRHYGKAPSDYRSVEIKVSTGTITNV